MTNSPTKVLAIGLDSADRTHLFKLVADGELPRIRALADGGICGRLTTPPALGDDAVWTTFSTALPPGQHGRFFWKGLSPASYATHGFGDDDPARRPFWQSLSAQGIRVAAIDVPKSPMCRLEGGLQLSDWMVHGRDGATRSWPPEVAAEVLARFGDDRIDRFGTDDFLCREQALPPELQGEFYARLTEGLDKKRRATLEFLDRGGWDLFLVVFKESHCVGHEFWEASAAGPRARGAGVPEDPVGEVYRALDRAVGELVDRVDDQTHVLLFSTLGMAPNYTGEHLLDRALLRLESPLPHPVTDLYPRLLELEQRILARWFPDTERSLVRGLRRAFQVEHNELSGAIRLNLRGREPSGRLQPGAEAEAWTRELEAALLELVDADTGHPAVDRVERSDRRFPGERREALPDLFVVWNREHPITGLASERIGTVRAGDPGFRPGNHAEDGFYIVCGPRVDHDTPLDRDASIMDLGPTIAALLGADLPNVEGRSLL
jgi:predicted AlkP superfamily phosphohydrolase/phosphomutase